MRSNIPLRPDLALGPDLRDPGHVVIDFGDDSMTRGRAHPMIDPSLRLERIAVEAADPTCGVLLLDLVLGHGAHPDPAPELADAIRAARGTAAAAGRDLPVVVSLTATEGDPQGRDRSAGDPRRCRRDRAPVQRQRDAARDPPPRPAHAASGEDSEPDGIRHRPRRWGERSGALHGLLSSELSVATAGAGLFADSLRAQAVSVIEADWQPPMPGTERELATCSLTTGARRRTPRRCVG